LSVSVPFLTPSEHVAAAHVPFEQKPVAQSPPDRQPWPVAHVGHVPPPQSVPVSAPFFAPSEHVGA
jgi:hypothetical protein